MDKTLTVYIVDDDPLARERIINIIGEDPSFAIVGETGDSTQAISEIQNRKPDILFLDIHLGDAEGFDILEKINMPKFPIIIFITAFSNYAIKAFEYFAFDYLLKPFKTERLERTLLRIKTNRPNVRPEEIQQKLNAMLRYMDDNKKDHPGSDGAFIPIKSNSKISFVKPNDIIYIEANGYYIELHTENKKYLLRENMSGILKTINQPNFKRIHRSVIINLHHISEIVKSNGPEFSVKLDNGLQFRIGRSYKDELFKLLNLG